MNIKQDGGFGDHVLRCRIESVIDGLTRQIGGGEADIDEDLEMLHLMKKMLLNLDVVKIERSRHDQGFL